MNKKELRYIYLSSWQLTYTLFYNQFQRILKIISSRVDGVLHKVNSKKNKNGCVEYSQKVDIPPTDWN